MRAAVLKVGQAIAIGALACVGVLLVFSLIPTLFGYEHFVVVGGSMGRAMPRGSVAITRLEDVRSLSVGDIVSYRTESGTRVTHRVIGFQNQDGKRVVETQGDTNATPDPEPLVLSGRVAKVEWVMPYVGFALRWARSPAGVVLLVLMPLIGLVFDRRPRKKKKKVLDAREAFLAAAPHHSVVPPSDCASIPHPAVKAGFIATKKRAPRAERTKSLTAS